MDGLYRDYGQYLAERFEGKVQKISINAGNSCPNRDGTIGRGGCLYCNNAAFVPGYVEASEPVARQLAKGIAFFARKYPTMRYLAYFQANTSTNTSAERFIRQAEEATRVDGVAGIVVGTRPDCVSDALLDRLAAINDASMPVIMEYGAESSHDTTLSLINRGHRWSDTVRAVQATAQRGMDAGLHLIMGLPGEDEAMMMQTIDRVDALPVSSVKLHQLQIIDGTALARLYARQQSGEAIDFPPITVFDLDEYVDLCVRIVRRLRPDIAIDRFVSSSPASMLVAPRWGLKNHEFTALVRARLAKEDATQGQNRCQMYGKDENSAE